MHLFPDDPRQALRCRRILLAVLAYCMWAALGAFLYFVGVLRIGLVDLGLYWATVLGANLVFLVMVMSGVNRRLADPSMTFIQIAASIIFAIWFIAVVEPRVRGVTLLLFVSGLFFGVFRLKVREFIALAFLAVALYAGLVFWEARVLDAEELQVQVAQVVVLGAVLLWLAVMGSYVAGLRSNLREALRRIEVLAHTDDLTGTENRRSITAALERAIDAAEPVAVCLLDIDHFKAINDECGHPAGDEVLRQFVDRVSGCLRRDDMLGRGSEAGALGRFGGEEFLVVLGATDRDGAGEAAERIRRAVDGEPFEWAGRELPVTVSIGVAAHRQGDSEVELLRRADRALYRAKERGRNRVCIADEPERTPATS